MRPSSWPLLLSAALAACGGVSVVADQRGGPYGAEEYAKVGAQAPVPVVVTGSAAGASGRALAERVVRDMAGADWGYHARFVPAAAPDPASVYWYVMLFDPPAGVTTAEACASARAPAGEGIAPEAGTGGVRLAAGLCRYDKIASSVQARAGAVNGLDDPTFRSLVRSAVLELTRPNQSRFDRSRDNGGSSSGSGGANQP